MAFSCLNVMRRRCPFPLAMELAVGLSCVGTTVSGLRGGICGGQQNPKEAAAELRAAELRAAALRAADRERELEAEREQAQAEEHTKKAEREQTQADENIDKLLQALDDSNKSEALADIKERLKSVENEFQEFQTLGSKQPAKNALDTIQLTLDEVREELWGGVALKLGMSVSSSDSAAKLRFLQKQLEAWRLSVQEKEDGESSPQSKVLADIMNEMTDEGEAPPSEWDPSSAVVETYSLYWLENDGPGPIFFPPLLLSLSMIQLLLDEFHFQPDFDPAWRKAAVQLVEEQIMPRQSDPSFSSDKKLQALVASLEQAEGIVALESELVRMAEYHGKALAVVDQIEKPDQIEMSESERNACMPLRGVERFVLNVLKHIADELQELQADLKEEWENRRVPKLRVPSFPNGANYCTQDIKELMEKIMEKISDEPEKTTILILQVNEILSWWLGQALLAPQKVSEEDFTQLEEQILKVSEKIKEVEQLNDEMNKIPARKVSGSHEHRVSEALSYVHGELQWSLKDLEKEKKKVKLGQQSFISLAKLPLLLADISTRPPIENLRTEIESQGHEAGETMLKAKEIFTWWLDLEPQLEVGEVDNTEVASGQGKLEDLD